MTRIYVYGLSGLHVEGPQWEAARKACGDAVMHAWGNYHYVEVPSATAHKVALQLMAIQGIKAEADARDSR